MTENNNNKINGWNTSEEIEKKETLLGTYVWLLGTDCWQLGSQKQIIDLFPNSPKLQKLIKIAQILDKYQKEITYYQGRISGILVELEKQKE